MSMQTLGAIIRQLSTQITETTKWSGSAFQTAASKELPVMQFAAGSDGLSAVQLSQEFMPQQQITHVRAYAPPVAQVAHNSHPEVLRNVLLAIYRQVANDVRQAELEASMDNTLVVLSDAPTTRAFTGSRMTINSMMRLVLPQRDLVCSVTMDRTTQVHGSASWGSAVNNGWFATSVSRTHELAIERVTNDGPAYIQADGYVEMDKLRLAYFLQTVPEFGRDDLCDPHFVTALTGAVREVPPARLNPLKTHIPAMIRKV